jgi:hypothetical protein
VGDKEIIVSGGLKRIASLRAEYYEWVDNPQDFVSKLKASHVRANLFTFLQPVRDENVRYNYHMEMESISVLPITNYDHWWKKQINDKTRNMIRRAGKTGVEIRVVPFTDELVSGIQAVYNESPLRQGRPFAHYNKDFETLKQAHNSYVDQSDFIGAFYKGELIGFIKLVHDQYFSHTMQIISMVSHRDKAPTNALLAKAVEICADRKVPYLHYGIWSKRGLGDFKKHHAFERLDLPRYFVPLTLRGNLILKTKMHHKLSQRLPDSWVEKILPYVIKWYSFKMRAK